MSLKIDTSKMKAALRDYSKVSRRTETEIVNTKAFYIARGAVFHTPKADKGKIQSDLKKLFEGQHIKKFSVVRYNMNTGEQIPVPLVALLINASRGQRGLPGLYGDKMKKAVNSYVSSKYRSIAFLKAGWIPAIKGFEKLAKDKSKAKPMESDVKQFKEPHGRFTAANDSGYVARALLENFAVAKGKMPGGFERIVSRGLQDAFNDEIASMRQYIQDKMMQASKPYSVK